MPSVVLVRRGRFGAVVADALVQEGIGFVEIGADGLGALADGAMPNARVLVLPAPLDRAGLAHLSRWRERGGATVLIGADWPAEVVRELTGARELPHEVSGGRAWPASAAFALPALAPGRSLQITGARRLYAADADDTETLALASAPPSAVAVLDADRDGFIDDEWYFCGPSICRLSRGRPVVEELSLPTLGVFVAQAAAAGDFTGDGFADDLVVASGETFALRRGGVWSDPRRAPAPIRHILAHPGPGRTWAIHVFVGDGSLFHSSFDGGRSFGPPSVFAPGGVRTGSDFSYSFEYVDAGGARRTALHVWSGGGYHEDLGLGFGPVRLVARLGPTYMNASSIRPGLGFSSDAGRRGLRNRITLVVGDNLHRMDPATGSSDYPRALHATHDVAKSPLVVRQGKTIAFLFDLEGTVRDLQQGRSPRGDSAPSRGPWRPSAPQADPAVAPLISSFDDWVDYTAWELPQADLHERLLRQAIVALMPSPLPRLWYWPEGARSVASISHDVEVSGPGQAQAVRKCTMEIARRCAAEGRRDTFFVLDAPEPAVLQSSDVADITALGHKVALHFNAFVPGGVSAANLRAQAARLRALGAPTVSGNRTHGLVWPGVHAPRALAAEPEIFYDSTLGGGPGFSHCGSVLPFRIYDSQGEPFSSFEEVPHALMDVADADFYFDGLAPPGQLTMSIDELFDRARDLASRNDEALYGVVDCSFHPVVVAGLVPPIRPFLERVTAYARFLTSEGIASMSLEEIAAWWRRRRALRIVGVVAAGPGRLEFTLEADMPVASPAIVLPAEWEGRSLAEVSAAGRAVPWKPHLLDGMRAALAVLAGVEGRTEVAARYER